METTVLDLKRDSPEFGVTNDNDSMQIDCTPKLGGGKALGFWSPSTLINNDELKYNKMNISKEEK